MFDQGLVLVTGGSGYFGTVLVEKLVAENYKVRVLDLNYPEFPVDNVDYVIGDICDIRVCLEATYGVITVFHNIAQVPLANNSRLFQDVNIGGTRNICTSSMENGVRNFVYTSSSAVYGIPLNLPVRKSDPKIPFEDYGLAKLEGELIAKQLSSFGIQVKIVRPRTILGLGRLGIFGILFGWISKGINIYTLGEGNEPYQFIHAEDLAEGIFRASRLNGDFEFNLGAMEFKTFKEDLESLCKFSNSGSQVIALNEWLIRPGLKLVSRLGFLPFAAYQLNLYSKPMYFDCRSDWEQLDYYPRYSNSEMLIDSYTHFMESSLSSKSVGLSHHQKTPKAKSLAILEIILKRLSKLQNLFR